MNCYREIATRTWPKMNTFMHLSGYPNKAFHSARPSVRPTDRQSDPDTMTNTALEAIASSIGKNRLGILSLSRSKCRQEQSAFDRLNTTCIYIRQAGAMCLNGTSDGSFQLARFVSLYPTNWWASCSSYQIVYRCNLF